jgi:hypothetical protein
MQTQFKETNEAPNKFWAAQDARMRNIKNKSLYPARIHLRVDRMIIALGELYAGKIYEAYNPKRVSVKIDKPVVKDSRWLKMLEADWAKEGITKTQTPQGLLYRII